MKLSHKLVNRLMGLGVFAFAFGAFLSTMAPTVSFWDCGEYIASSASLGVPHPPGNPLFILLGRVFMILFTGLPELAARMTLLSVTSGALVALILYHIVVKALAGWMGEPTQLWQRVTLYVSGIVGALFGVLNYTFWFSAVESSEAVPAILPVVLNVYIALVWAQSKERNRDRYLVLFSYVAFLGIGIHMSSMFALFPVFVYILMVDPSKLKDWRLWGIGMMLGSVMYGMSAFFFVTPPLLVFAVLRSYWKGEKSIYVSSIITLIALFVVYHFLAEDGAAMTAVKNSENVDLQTKWFVLILMLIYMGFSFVTETGKQGTEKLWKLPFFIVLFAALGFSVNAVIPIRAALQPMINENHPSLDLSTGKKMWESRDAFVTYVKNDASRRPLLIAYATFLGEAKDVAPTLFAEFEENFARGLVTRDVYDKLVAKCQSTESGKAAYTSFRNALLADPTALKLYGSFESSMGTISKVQWEEFRGFLERKQYGTESMITRMFSRRGSLFTQFGIDGNMGYAGYHITQFFHFGQSIEENRRGSGADGELYAQLNPLVSGPFHVKILMRLVYLIPTAFMIFAMVYWTKKQKNDGVFFINLFLITSIILVLYMNFADGTRPNSREDVVRWSEQVKQWDVAQSRLQIGQQMPMPRPELPVVHREVRVRDYFFTNGFVFFGMWMGFAVAALLNFCFTSESVLIRRRIAPLLALLFLASPALPFMSNYAENQRGNDWLPYDYAYNLLMSCEKGGVLFTNGDNDTFPLWFLQEAAGIRRDVRIVNLSLGNTKWYIKQLRTLEPKVPMDYTDLEIDGRLNHIRNPYVGEEIELKRAGMKVTPPDQNRKPVLQIQDQLVLEVVDAARGKKPIYFSVTVSDNDLMGLRPYLRQEGLVYRVMTDSTTAQTSMDFERTRYLLTDVYSFRNLGDGSMLMTETSRRLMYNYTAAFLQYAFALSEPLVAARETLKQPLAEGQTQQSRDSLQQWYSTNVKDVANLLDRCVSLVPWDMRTRAVRHGFMATFDMESAAMKRLPQALEITRDPAELLMPNYSNYRNPYFEKWNQDVTVQLQK